jgi:hypothetical protein
MLPVGVQIAGGIHTTTHPEPPAEMAGVTLPEIGYVAAFVLPKESPPALNLGVERANDYLEGFIHG